MTPYEATYGQNSMSMAYYVSCTSEVHAVDRTLDSREDVIHTLRTTWLWHKIA